MLKNKRGIIFGIANDHSIAWGIAKKFDGLSVRKIKSLNNLIDDHLKLGTKIIIPTIS